MVTPYKVTLAVCSRTSPHNLQVLRRFSQKVYATPSRRKMEGKGESEEMTYPHISFAIDNFEDMFDDVVVRDMVARWLRRILESYVFGPSGFWTMAPLRYAAKLDPFLSLDCAPTPSTLAQSKERKGSNFAIWQH